MELWSTCTIQNRPLINSFSFLRHADLQKPFTTVFYSYFQGVLICAYGVERARYHSWFLQLCCRMKPCMSMAWAISRRCVEHTDCGGEAGAAIRLALAPNGYQAWHAAAQRLAAAAQRLRLHALRRSEHQKLLRLLHLSWRHCVVGGDSGGNVQRRHSGRA